MTEPVWIISTPKAVRQRVDAAVAKAVQGGATDNVIEHAFRGGVPPSAQMLLSWERFGQLVKEAHRRKMRETE